MRGDNCVAGELRIFVVPTFYSGGKCTMPLTSTQSYLMLLSQACVLCSSLFPLLNSHLGV